MNSSLGSRLSDFNNNQSLIDHQISLYIHLNATKFIAEFIQTQPKLCFAVRRSTNLQIIFQIDLHCKQQVVYPNFLFLIVAEFVLHRGPPFSGLLRPQPSPRFGTSQLIIMPGQFNSEIVCCCQQIFKN